MYNYLFSLFSRYSIVISGFLVFIYTSSLFGPEGRGFIAVGGSIISIIGILFSLNLGRSFIALTKKNKTLKENLIKSYIKTHLMLIAVAVLFAFVFMNLSDHVYGMFPKELIYFFLIGVPFYLWGVNNNDIFAAFDMTFKQEVIIVLIRFTLVLSLVLLWIFELQELSYFLLVYYFILSGGSIIEMFYIFNKGRLRDFSLMKKYLSKLPKLLGFAHLDYLAFHLFPFFLILLSTIFLNIKDVGILNFTLQIISFIFLLSVVASIRMKSYVAVKGSNQYSKSITLLFFVTLFLSFFGLIFCLLFIQDIVNYFFSSFGDVRILLAILYFSIPGHLLYQFNLPILIENNALKRSATLNGMNFLFSLFIGFFTIQYFGVYGFCIAFILFYIILIPINLSFWLDNYAKKSLY